MKQTGLYIGTTLALLLIIPVAFGQISSELENPCKTCGELKNLILPDVVITETNQLENPVSHCKIAGIIGGKIGFELLLPKDWNVRFVMGGGGGFVGAIHNMAAYSLIDGYATAGTDAGHKGNGYKGDWALNNAEAQLNFGYLAVHRTAVVSKEIIRQFYCLNSSFNYFFGCSRGGGQGMMEAQRFPDDFDGIVSGAPAYNWTAWGAKLIQNTQAIYPDPLNLKEPVITSTNMKLLQKIILEQCDAIDILEDQILNDPRECEIDLDLLPKCPNNSAQNDCFTSNQIEAIKTIYAGVNLGETEVYPGFPFGGENEERGWRDWIVGPSKTGIQLNFPSKQYAFGTDVFKYFVFNNPNWDYSSYDFSEFFNTTRFASSFLNATSTDYSRFKDQGGKMILYHGWSDPAFSALSTIEHFEKATSIDGELDNYIRLFLLPGVLHCGGGPGPSQTNWLELIRNWVEEGIAPDRVILTKSDDEHGAMTRPVFPYPHKAMYDGKGDPYKESSFNKSTTTNK